MKPINQKIFFISDLHFYHDNIIKYCKRPYSNSTEMNDDIIKRWNATVGKDDIVWNLGDFAFVKKHNSKLIAELVSKLNGHQYLILGNHDRRISRNMNFWYKMGFERVYDKPVLFQDRYILSHEPLLTKHHLDLTNTDLRNIHGHTHNSCADFYAMTEDEKPQWNSGNPKFQPIKDITKNSFNVSIEVINYSPIRFEQIVTAITNANLSVDDEPEQRQNDIQLPRPPTVIPLIPDENKRILPLTSDPYKDIPEACKGCSNRNPDGSLKGPCFCILGTPPVMC